MAGGPEEYIKLMNDIRNTPMGPHWPNHPPKKENEKEI